MSQEDFARRVGVSRRQVVYWECDGDAPSAASLTKVCEVLHVSADWLLTGRWLRDVHDLEFYRRQQSLHLSRTANTRRGVRLFTTLPLDLENERVVEIDALPEDEGAVALRIHGEEYAPTYMPGDTLLMRPLALRVTDPKEHEAVLLGLHEKHLAVTLNRESSIKRFELNAVTKGTWSVHLHSVARAETQTVGSADDLLIQAAVYKCVRQV
jgi:transcriptional regulator with XRE-family HTH domain